MVERKLAGTERHEGYGERRPRQMEVGPTLRHDELDHTSHDQEGKRAEARRESQDQQYRQSDLRKAVEVREHGGKGKIVRMPEDVQLELVLEEVRRRRRQGQEAAPTSSIPI